MKDFFNYLKSHNILVTISIIMLCSITYLIRKNIDFTTQSITYINLTIIGVLVVVLFNAVRKHYILWRYIVCLLSLLFVFNGYYDEKIFFKTFHFKLLYFWIGISLVAIIAVFYPYINKFITQVLDFLNEWGRQAEKKDEHYMQKYQKRNNIGDDFVGNESDISENKEYKGNALGKPEQGNKDTHAILYAVIFILQLILPIILIFVSSSSTFSYIIEKIDSKNFPTIILSFIEIVILLVFATGLIVSLFIKWYQIIRGIVTNQQEGEKYFILACSLFLISQYILKNHPYTTDDFANILLDGKLFTFPLSLLILIPIFLIFAENIKSFTKKNELIDKTIKNCANRTIKIATNIIDSLLTFIEFVTSDYLSSIIDITKEDEEDFDKIENDIITKD